MNYDFVCSLSISGVTLCNSKELLQHIKEHIKEGFSMKCPIINCKSSYKIVSSLTSHIARSHKYCKFHYSKAFKISDKTEQESRYQNQYGNEIEDITDSSTFPCTSKDCCVTIPIEKDTLKSHALFLLALQYQHFIPISIVSCIAEEIKTLLISHKQVALDNLYSVLLLHNITAETAATIIENVSPSLNCDYYVDGALRTEYTRQKYYKNFFSFVKPITYNLPDDFCCPSSFQYIPILQTLKIMLKNPTVKKHFLNPQNTSKDPDILCDYTDGICFKNNLLFRNCKKTIHIILYQDSFEVVNPLGSAKSVHKVIAVYFTLGNLYKHNRSSTNLMQLVILCKEKCVKAENQIHLFQPLLNDLQVLETNGIDIGLPETVRGSIIAITGDNLGSHWIGGFLSSFSKSYVCRYCSNNTELSARTPASYDLCVRELQYTKKSNVLGIKFSSVFNKLSFYHVCNPGLPPCIAHDLFEGVVAYDMMLFINYFFSNGWFTENYLNNEITLFKYDPTSALNKPVPLKKEAKRLGGNAAQNWCFLRMFSLFVIQKVKSIDDKVWKAYLLLRQIVELACAPSITKTQISLMSFVIDEYMEMRLNCFPEVCLRPKHHYIKHYPWLTLQFGPLINFWTLRFESKHSYFKRSIRSCKNFVNVTSTLANAHQLFQAYLEETDQVFKTVVQESKEDRVVFCNEIANIIHAYRFDMANCVVCKHVIHKGTCYKLSQFLVLNREELDLRVGKIRFIFLHEEEVWFVVKVFIAYYVPYLGIYCLNDDDFSLQMCVSIYKLHDYYPLYCYHAANGFDYLVLKHNLV